ncbi:MAG TPA: DUF92 domain-containing protein [Brevefilum sp.]|nr:DUF92 domain-containing protein [Brevefilum sp.]
MVNFFIGMFVGVSVAYLAYRARALNRGGAVAAAVLGTVVFGMAGAGWAVVMLTFFVSSSLLSKLFRARKAATGPDFAKGSNRDAWQVLANGGVSGAAALAYFVLQQVHPAGALAPILWVGFVASLAGANADTWATELGMLNPRQPLLLTTLRRVPQGTSGAVSLAGTLAALVGSALVGGMAVWVTGMGWAPALETPPWKALVAIAVGGVLGSLVDSLLGATLQAIYFCPACQKETEKHPQHTCGGKTVHQRGLAWLNNDGVNFLCTLSAALAGVIIYFMLMI